MGVLKPPPKAVSGTALARLQGVIWVLIYAGLLALVLGIVVDRVDEDDGQTLMLAGALVAAVGFGLIYARSKIRG